MKIKKGTTRVTLLIGKYAIKAPIMSRSLKHFAKGWLGNLDENNTWKATKNEKLCPVLFSLFGFMNVMPRARQLLVTDKFPNSGFDKQEMLKEFKSTGLHIDVCSGWKNFGWLNDKLVLLDYANDRESGEECSDCDENCVLKDPIKEQLFEKGITFKLSFNDDSYLRTLDDFIKNVLRVYDVTLTRGGTSKEVNMCISDKSKTVAMFRFLGYSRIDGYPMFNTMPGSFKTLNELILHLDGARMFCDKDDDLQYHFCDKKSFMIDPLNVGFL